MTRFALHVSIVLALVAGTYAGARAGLRPPHFAACRLGPGFTRFVTHCGAVEVYENRATRMGRTIALKVIEVDAVRRSHRAIFWNPGGPGGSDSDNVPAVLGGQGEKELLALHDAYDLVFVDNRGTGDSHAQTCDLAAKRYPERYYAQLFPSAAVRACRTKLAKIADLNQYTTDITVDDLDDVRAALGYSRIVLDGGSYGTMLYLDYARRHPAHVESIVLQGVAPPGIFFIPLGFAQGAQTAMDDLIRDCANDALCHKAFPTFGEQFGALLRRFDRGPLPVTIRNAVTKRLQRVALSKEVFVDQLRHVLYDNDGSKYIPYIVEQATLGNDGPLSRMIELFTTFTDTGQAIGLNLSVTCAEDLPFITEAQIATSSANAFQGDTRVRAQQEACRIWNVRRASASFAQPVRSDAPILMISGASDPATPPQFGREALRYLRNARQIVIPHATHDVESACTDALLVAFVRARSAKGIDGTKCVVSAKRPPFATSLQGFGT